MSIRQTGTLSGGARLRFQSRRTASESSDRKCGSKGAIDRNRKRTYHAFIVIKEAMMQKVAVETLRDFAELVALGAFLTMIALAARAFGA
jgi:hypothetical protein